MSDFTPSSAIIGGALIALGLSGMLLGAGRIAGVSGVLGRLLHWNAGDVAWRLAFLGGLVAGGLVFARLYPKTFEDGSLFPSAAVIVSGVLVGFGTRLGNGCTSGHGICGNSRLSKRSLVATLVFMLTGMATATALGLGTGAP